MKRNLTTGKKLMAVCLMGIVLAAATSCGTAEKPDNNLILDERDRERVVNLFGPMEKSKPGVANVARNAFDQTVIKAEDQLDLTVEYRTYTAENYKEKTYDDVVLDRVRSDMDDLYLLNPDTIQTLGDEGRLLDLSDLDCVKIL